MQFDMGGSGATLGAAKAISLIQPAGVQVGRAAGEWAGGGQAFYLLNIPTSHQGTPQRTFN
jgi:leucyl aminopeptidase